MRVKLPSERWARGLAAAGLVIAALSPLTAWALPQGGTVSAGSATLTLPSSTSLRVAQSTDRLIMDWRSFNIWANESVRFQQPSAASIALNRVAGQEPSGIYGSLTANGQIFLINPSGILFGSSSRVDVAGLTASTLNITNQDFLAGNYRFNQMPGYANAAVVNQGVITAGPGGYVALLGAAVRNEGVIQANLGSIALAAGKAATLDMRGDGLIEFVVTDAVSGSVTGRSGESLASYVSNTGTLQADGGMVTLTANAAVDVIKSVVNQEGVIRAQSMVERNGVVVLSGGPEGIVSVSGTIDASSTGAGQTGGNVQVLGEKVGLFGGHINASGDAGGGTVLFGGDLHGEGTVPNASRTYVSPGSTINADAITNGSGGKVVVWSNDGTQFYGAITARGGANSGDGGFVEVSGKHYLDFRGLVDLRAPRGSTGTLLLDPTEITITHGVVDTGITPVGSGPFTDTATVPATGGTLSDNTINTQLFVANVTVQTSTGDIVVDTTGVAIQPFSGLVFSTNNNTLTLNSAANISWGNPGWSYTNGAGAGSNGQLTLYAAGGNIASSGTLTIGGTSPLLLQAMSGIGSSGTPIATSGVTSLAATTDTGGIFISESTSGNVSIDSLTNPITTSVVTGLATTTSGDISLQNTAGDITISQPVSAAGFQVSLAASGSILGSGLITASDLVLEAGTAIGSSGAFLPTDATNLAAISGNGGIYIHELDFGGDGLTIDQLASLTHVVMVTGLSATGGNIAVLVDSGDLTLNEQASAAGKQVSLATATGSILQGTNSVITAKDLVMEAGTAIGASGTPVRTDVTNVAASAVNGGIYIHELDFGADGLTVSALTSEATTTLVTGIIATGDIALKVDMNSLTLNNDVTTSGASAVITSNADSIDFSGGRLVLSLR